jgi:hypothetical protein
LAPAAAVATPALSMPASMTSSPSRSAPPPPAPGPGSTARPADESTETLAAERALLDEARTAIAHNETTLAGVLLERHARDFPHAQLVEEREALSIEAFAAAGRNEEARTALSRFRVRYPKSLFLSAVEAVVRGP